MFSALFCFLTTLHAQGPGRVDTGHLAKDVAASADPQAAHWKKVQPLVAMNDRFGKPAPDHRMEVRTLWSDKFLYVLYTCPYKQLNVIARPTQTQETNHLWNYDVAELFIGDDFQNINLYKEFEISPQGEWVDLDIDREHMDVKKAILWDSHMEVKCRIDKEKKVWYGEMKIPLRALTARPVKAGTEMRVNFYRIQEPEPNRVYIAWQPVNNQSFHTPQAFGRIRFVQ
ncbi:MAG: carbohydrate-binding family 9-like protein [Acidobacteria bacterium]|nr:carbohydrate-binding family 9-like protein [Acidobacteriota bacterium]